MKEFPKRDWRTLLWMIFKHLKEQSTFFSKITHLFIVLVTWLSYSGPAAWNTLPSDLHYITDTSAFRKRLKNVLFDRAYHWLLLALLDVSYSGALQILRWLIDCIKRQQHLFRLASNLWPLTSTLSLPHLEMCTAACIPEAGEWCCVNACYEINLSWYPVSSKLASYICQHWKLVVYSLHQKLCWLISICWSYLKI